MITYVAAPYTHEDSRVIQQRMEAFAKSYASIITGGDTAVSPLINHFIFHLAPDLGSDWTYWQEYSESLLRRCDSLTVLMMPGWEESTGVRGEIDLANKLGIPVFFSEMKEMYQLEPA